MHRIIASHLKTFPKEHEIESSKETERFEHFVNYCIASKYYSGRIDTSDITTGEDDAGIDGIIIIADGELITTEEEINDVFESHKRNIEIDFIFVQAKTSEKFEKNQITNFSEGVYDFLSEEPELPHGDLLSEAHKIFSRIIDNVSKVKGGKPNAKTYFVTTGIWRNEKELSASLKTNQRKIDSTGYFGKVECLKIDRDELIKLWSSIHQPVEATVRVKGYVPYENIRGVKEAYICVIPAKNFINSILKEEDDDDHIKSGIFDENVRAFLGADNSVNSNIKATLNSSEKRDRFAILNNGITIVSPDVRVQSDSISIFNYQIVNGCQTSHVLFRNKDLVDDSTMLTVKVIEVNDENIVNQIVEATNNQSYVADEKFLSLRAKAKNVEVYFNGCNDNVNEDSKIYFERREKQYAGMGISDSKIFDIRTVARAFSAMFLEIPHTAANYPTRIFQQSGNRLFQDEHNEIAYYCSTLAFYKFRKLVNNRKIPNNPIKYKWYALMLLKYVIKGNKKTPELGSKKITNYCEDIIKVLSSPREEYISKYEKCMRIVEAGGWVSKDRLKSSKHTEELKQILASKKIK